MSVMLLFKNAVRPSYLQEEKTDGRYKSIINGNVPVADPGRQRSPTTFEVGQWKRDVLNAAARHGYDVEGFGMSLTFRTVSLKPTEKAEPLDRLKKALDHTEMTYNGKRIEGFKVS